MRGLHYERLYRSKRVYSQTYQWEYHTKGFTHRESIQQVWIQRSLLRREVFGVTNMIEFILGFLVGMLFVMIIDMTTILRSKP